MLNKGLFTSDTVEHYTPAHILKVVVSCMGHITLDPCSNSHTNPNVPALKHYTQEDNGLNYNFRRYAIMFIWKDILVVQNAKN